MNRQTLVDGYQPHKASGATTKVPPGRPAPPDRFPPREPSGPTASDKLPKTTSSVTIPKK